MKLEWETEKRKSDDVQKERTRRNFGAARLCDQIFLDVILMHQYLDLNYDQDPEIVYFFHKNRNP